MNKTSVGEKRKMPTINQIERYWANRLVEIGKFDNVDEVVGKNNCFACGFDSWKKNERAHIKAKVTGGKDSVENIHMLCSTCHKDSENLVGQDYERWFLERNILDRVISAGIRYGGVNPSSLINVPNLTLD